MSIRLLCIIAMLTLRTYVNCSIVLFRVSLVLYKVECYIHPHGHTSPTLIYTPTCPRITYIVFLFLSPFRSQPGSPEWSGVLQVAWVGSACEWVVLTCPSHTIPWRYLLTNTQLKTERQIVIALETCTPTLSVELWPTLSVYRWINSVYI